jgi:uncharacterized protein DUF4304
VEIRLSSGSAWRCLALNMEAKQFKKLFSEVAIANGFTWAHGGWFQESPECVVVLDLQKSNFGSHFELNLKVFIQGLFGRRYVQSKALVKKDTGDVFRRPPERYTSGLDLSLRVSDAERRDVLDALFREFVNPTAADALSREGLKSLEARGAVCLLPAVRQELNLPGREISRSDT